MVEHGVLINYELCTGCYACEVACQQENQLQAGVKWVHVVRQGPVRADGKLLMNFLPILCMHCEKPACVQACPANAITKRSDGIVLIDEAGCTGCQECIQVCPFSALQFNPEKNIVEKCTLCVNRVDKGLLPYCVQHCPARAMYFGNINEAGRLQQTKYAKIVRRTLIDAKQV